MPNPFLPDLPIKDIDAVMRHPAQTEAVYAITQLIGWLRRCRTFAEYDDLQRGLFQYLYAAETHRAQARRCRKRLTAGKPLSGMVPDLPTGRDPYVQDTWRIEDLVFQRVCRQLRCVGDALAWRISGYDRAYVVAVSSNAMAGPMVDKVGLPHELGAAVAMRDRGHFGLLHDLTNCLRIGDMTEFEADGRKWLHEVKKNPNSKRGRQTRRMATAVDAVMAGGPLPGLPGTRLVTPSIHCTTHTRLFASTIRRAQADGIAGAAVPGGRALTSLSFPALARSGGSAPGLDDWRAQRASATESAGIHTAQHHIAVTSAFRNHYVPTLTPVGVFPLTPAECALIICDAIIFEVVIDPDRLARAFAARGIAAEVSLPDSSGPLSGVPILTLSKGSRRLAMTQGAFQELLLEFLNLKSWVAALGELLDEPNVPRHPVVVMPTTRVWR
jgi:hypothetical protein